MQNQFEKNTLNTNCLGKVVIPLMVATCSFASQNIEQHNVNYYPSHFNFLQAHNWETELMGLQSTGHSSFFQNDLTNYYKLTSFSRKFISELVDVPPEFDKTFKKNFWDLLA